jgi:inosose dehydratase
MKIGCFALMEPFTPMRRQFEVIRELGFEFADLTDNHNGATLGTEYGFAASFSLDSHPSVIRDLAREFSLTLSSVCAHANLLDPTSPDRYGTCQIIRAIQLAHYLGIHHVITAEGDPHTEFGRRLTEQQKIFCVCEKLHEPIRWAEELGVELLIEPHGELTDTVEGMTRLLEALGHERAVGINLDTGNSWLGGGDPVQFIKVFGRRIKHVHWKDIDASWQSRRGQVFGCGMGTIPLGDGVVGIESVVKALLASGFDGLTTLEVVGKENVLLSSARLKAWAGALEGNQDHSEVALVR